ncbi:MAG: LacI family DNA-binding transcriptional regulator [Chloroflexota bacterium]
MKDNRFDLRVPEAGATVNPRKATSLDVARLAGVNQSTVSRALARDGKVSTDTRARVQAAARQLGYTPNAIARSLITQKTNIIGIVTADVTIPFQPYILEKFLQKLQARGRQVLVFTAAPDQQADELLPTAFQYQVDALVVTSVTLSSQTLLHHSRGGTRVVLFNRYMEGGTISSVTGDNRAAGRVVADFFKDSGHERLAYIAGQLNSSTNRDREQGFVTRLWERGSAKPQQESAGEYTYEAGRAAALRLLDSTNPPDAIFCASDILAIGAIDAATAIGLRVPANVSIVGVDDIPMARWDAYSLTTIRLPVDDMVDATIDLLLQEPMRLAEPANIRFPGSLIVRGSTRPRTPR